MKLNKTNLAGLFIMAAGVLASSTAAANLVTNGSFELTTGITDKDYFFGHVDGWSGGDNLTFIDYPGTADGSIYLAVYGPFPAVSPDGGNFVEGDGLSGFRDELYQTISGLTVGQQYLLSFYQAAGQQKTFTGATTERWKVTFGGDVQLSDEFSLPTAGVGLWQAQTMTFTATATEQVLGFLANGTPTGKPPISFLDGVSLEAVPDAGGTLLLLGASVAGLVGFAPLRRALGSTLA